MSSPSTDCTRLIRSTLRLRHENNITISPYVPLRLSFCHHFFFSPPLSSSRLFFFPPPPRSLSSPSPEFKGAAWREYKCPCCQRSHITQVETIHPDLFTIDNWCFNAARRNFHSILARPTLCHRVFSRGVGPGAAATIQAERCENGQSTMRFLSANESMNTSMGVKLQTQPFRAQHNDFSLRWMAKPAIKDFSAIIFFVIIWLLYYFITFF